MKGKFYLGFICVIVAVDSFVYGYDTAVISGAVEAIRSHFQLSALEIGSVVSSLLLGCVAGVLLVGRLTDWLGRRKMFMLSALIFLVSAVWCYYATSAAELIVARVLGGVGVGFASLLVPVYIAEISPPESRGMLVSLHQLGIVIGMNVAYVVNAWLGRGGDEVWLADQGWRVMLGACAIPAFLFLLLTPLIPESPRWLIKRGKDSEALAVLQRLHGEQVAQAEAKEIRETVNQEQGRIRELFRPGVRGVMFMAMTLALFQAITGITVVVFYAATIFHSVGIGIEGALVHQATVGIALVTGTITSMFVVDRLGRRPIMLMAISAMGVSLIFMASSLSSAGGGGWTALIWTLIFVYAFNFGMGGIYWVVVSEIFPTRIRGTASSLSIIFLWGGNYFVLLFFPTLLEHLHGNVFYLFAGTSALCLAFMWRFVPETKGRTLEKIEHELYGLGDHRGVSGGAGRSTESKPRRP